MLTDRIHHFGLTVAYLESAVAWYQEKLDFRVEKRFALPEARLEIVKLIAPSGVRLELLWSSAEGALHRDASDLNRPGEKHLCFEVEDIEEAAREIEERGITLLQPPKVIEASREKNCWIADLEGNPIEFIEEMD